MMVYCIDGRNSIPTSSFSLRPTSPPRPLYDLCLHPFENSLHLTPKICLISKKDCPEPTHHAITTGLENNPSLRA